MDAAKPKFIYGDRKQYEYLDRVLHKWGRDRLAAGRNLAAAAEIAASLVPNGVIDVLEPFEFKILKQEIRRHLKSRKDTSARINFESLPERVAARRDLIQPVAKEPIGDLRPEVMFEIPQGNAGPSVLLSVRVGFLFPYRDRTSEHGSET